MPAMVTENRPPHISLDSTSRPRWSVPSQCSVDGLASRLDRSWAAGSYGAIHGVSSSTTTTTARIAAPR